MSRFTIEREFFTPPEIAKLVGSRPEAVLGWIHGGELAAVNFARKGAKRPRFRVRRDDLEAFLRSRTQYPAPKRPAPKPTLPASVKRYV